jgi:hypothetical protein
MAVVIDIAHTVMGQVGNYHTHRRANYLIVCTIIAIISTIIIIVILIIDNEGDVSLRQGEYRQPEGGCYDLIYTIDEGVIAMIVVVIYCSAQCKARCFVWRRCIEAIVAGTAVAMRRCYIVVAFGRMAVALIATRRGCMAVILCMRAYLLARLGCRGIHIAIVIVAAPQVGGRCCCSVAVALYNGGIAIAGR